jgi:serine/threonine-protein kinase
MASGEREGNGGTRYGPGVMGEGVSAPERFKPELVAGAIIDGKYRLERLLGEGGMGSVWGAHHLQLDLPVAIKLLRSGSDPSPVLSERLKIEARAAAQLVHPAIVRVFDVDTSEEGDDFIVMELLAGESLSDVFDRGRLSSESAVQIMLPIAEALALAHGKGVVHRDLKPQNVFMAQDEDRLQPKLLDFGIAKLTSAPVNGGLTETGIPIGSPDYMSPEQARGVKDVDYRADVWAFSVVLYEAVTGHTPFTGDNYNALMRAIVETEPAPLVLDQNLDQGLVELILWGLAKDRDARPGSMQELGRELARWLLDRGVKEDVCGNPLGPRWITRTAQKSVPVIHVDGGETSRRPPLVHTETLVSPRLVHSRAPAAVSIESPTPPARPAPKRWPWAAAGLGLLLVSALAWALFSRAPARSAAEPPGPPSNPGPSAAPPAALASPPALAPTPATPASAAAASTPSSGNSVSAIPPASASNKGGQSRPATLKPTPAAQPARVEHDDARELLQAY